MSIEELVGRARSYLEEGYPDPKAKPEAQTKQDLIEPLLRLLGWTDDPSKTSRYRGEFGTAEVGRRWADYALIIDDEPKVFIEVKGLEESDLVRKHSQQLLEMQLKKFNRENKKMQSVYWGILTNFRELHLFYYNDKEPFLTVELDELTEKFELIKRLLSPERVKEKSIEYYYRENSKTPIDEQFLKDLKKWRLVISNGFLKSKPTLTKEEIEEASQRYLDRLIFIRILERGELLPPSWLTKRYVAWREGNVGFNQPFAQVIRDAFRSFESLYNTELFKPNLCDVLDIENVFLEELIKSSDRPDPLISRVIGIPQQNFDDKGVYGYNFNVLTLDIIGSVYERFLAHELTLKDGRALIEETPELRKKEGAYYTPSYVVDYIIDNTLRAKTEPIVDEAIRLLESSEFELAHAKINELASIKVVDPAFGSGSFLIKVFDLLCDGYDQYNKRAEEIDRELHRANNLHFSGSPIRVENVGERVLLNSIYGVDLDRKAVEVAKLNLWVRLINRYREDYKPITGRSVKRHLPSLELNLKHGNSLIAGAASRDEYEEFKDELRELYALERALKANILKRTPKREEWNREQFDELEREFRENKKRADEIRAEVNERLNESLRERFGDDYRGKHPLNWELEFPEVFFTDEGVLKENAGFDVVVGNPPYVRQERLGEDKPYLERAYRVYHGVADLYVYFFERAHELLKSGGSFGFISSNKFMRSNYGKPLRSYLRNGIHIKQIVDFGELPVFKDAATFPAIFLTEKVASDAPTTYTPVRSLDFTSLESIVKEQGQSLPASAFEGENWTLASLEEIAILRKMDAAGVPLGEYVDGKIYYGIKTGLNKAFIIDRATRDRLIAEDAKSEEIIKPLLVGDDIRKYHVNWRGRYLIFTRRGINIDEYPAIKRHLSQFKEELTPKKSKGEKVGRKPGSYEWYEIQDSVEYYGDFEKPKIVFPDIAMSCRFAFDDEGFFPEATCFEIPVKDLYLLVLLNSRLIFFYIRLITPVLGDVNKRGRLRFKKIYLNNLPIPQIPLTTPSPEREQHLQELKELHTSYIETGELAPTLDRVREHLSAAPERSDAPNRSDVVHELLAFLAERMMQLKKQQKELLDLIPADSSIRFRNIRRDLQSWHISLLADTRVSDFKEFRGVKIKEFKLRYEDNALVVFHEEKGELLRLAFDDESFKKYMALMFAHWIERKGARTFRGEIELPSTLNLHLSIPTVLEELERRVGECDVVRLTEELERTDREIDRIVYELYGLTEDEIRLVEESLT